MTRLTVTVSSLFALMLAGCAAHGAKPVAKAPEQPRGPVIVRLVGQHETITVTSGPDGPMYSAATKDGQMIVANATLEQLRVQHPEVYELVAPTIAVDASLEGRPAISASNRTMRGASSERIIMSSQRD